MGARAPGGCGGGGTNQWQEHEQTQGEAGAGGRAYSVDGARGRGSNAARWEEEMGAGGGGGGGGHPRRSPCASIRPGALGSAAGASGRSGPRSAATVVHAPLRLRRPSAPKCATPLAWHPHAQPPWAGGALEDVIRCWAKARARTLSDPEADI